MARYVNIMAKVSPATAARMDAAVDKLGLRSKYEFMQLAVKLVLMYVDPGGEPMTPDTQEQIEVLRSLWGDVTHLRYEVATIKPNGGRRVEPSEIITFYGRECLMLRVTDGDGNITTTTNQRDVLESVLQKTLPAETLARLVEFRRTQKHPTLLAALMALTCSTKDSHRCGDEGQQMFRAMEDGDPRTVRLGLENKPARAKNKKKFE